MGEPSDLPKEEWDFSRLHDRPERERSACCFYELLRLCGKVSQILCTETKRAEMILECEDNEFPPWMNLSENVRNRLQNYVELLLRRDGEPVVIFSKVWKENETIYDLWGGKTAGHTPEIRNYQISMDLSASNDELVKSFRASVVRLRKRLGVNLRSKIQPRPEWNAWLKAIGAARLLRHCGERWEDSYLQAKGMNGEPPYEQGSEWKKCDERLDAAWDFLIGGNRPTGS